MREPSARRGGAPVRAVTVDLWNTLLYLRPPDRRVLEGRRRELWVGAFHSAGVGVRRAGEVEKARTAWCLAEERRGRTPTIPEQVRWAERRLGVTLPARSISRALDAALLSAPVRVYPGARSALRRLRRKRVRLGLVSNIVYETADGARRLLRRTGLARWFSAVVLSADAGAAKPSPIPFQRCLRQLGVPARAAVHVGDHPYDQLGAQRAGLGFVRFAGRPLTPLRGPARQLSLRGSPALRIEHWSQFDPAGIFHVQAGRRGGRRRPRAAPRTRPGRVLSIR